jgi:Putative adhesin
MASFVSIKMSKRTRINIFFLLAITVFLFNFERVTAQQASITQEGQKIVRAASSGETVQEGRVSIKLERGGHVAVDNRTTGRIRIIGWDRDTVEATATSERGVEAVRFAVKDSPDKFIWLKADYLKREGDDAPRPEPAPMPEATPITPAPSPALGIPPLPAELPKQIRMPGGSKSDIVIDPPRRDGRPIEVHLEVYVPRYAEIELIKVSRSPVEVTNVETPIVVLGGQSDVVLRNVGEGEVRTRSGSVEIEDAAGLVEVVTSSGAVRVRRAGGDVRVISISGNVEIDCVRGHVNVDTAGGSITLSNIQGDVEASASNSNVLYTGAIREDGRYHLKTMSGAVEMAVRDKPPGFTAALSSYRGTIENDFQLQIKQTREQHQEGEVNRRVVGRHGDGQAQITLDTFDGKVKLGKLAPGAMKECKLGNDER